MNFNNAAAFPTLKEIKNDLGHRNFAKTGITVIMADEPSDHLHLANELCLWRSSKDKIILFDVRSPFSERPNVFKGSLRAGGAMGQIALRDHGAECSYIVNLDNNWDSLEQISFLSAMAQKTLIVMLLPRPNIPSPKLSDNGDNGAALFEVDKFVLTTHFLLRYTDTLISHIDDKLYSIGDLKWGAGFPFHY